MPVELAELIPIKGNGEPELFELLQCLLPKSLINIHEPRGVTDSVRSFVSHYLTTFPRVLGNKDLPNGETYKQLIKNRLPEYMDSLHIVLSSVGEPIIEIIGAPKINVTEQLEPDLDIAISGLKVVDADSLSWKQILEFRKDKESQRKLRNYKLFLSDNYEEKSKQYIEDSLSTKIEEYEKTIKEWGMESVEATLDVVFSSKSLITLTAIGLATSFGAVPALTVGTTTAITLASAVGSFFTIGKLSIGINKRHRELREFRINDPVSYLIDIKSLNTKKGDGEIKNDPSVSNIR